MISTDELHRWTTRQRDEWPMAANNFTALSNIRTKSVDIGGFPFVIQFNPARAVSSGAKTDTASISRRPCFLCRNNRPAEQTSLQAGEFEILVNPFPIFPHHYTITHNSHRRQEIDGYWCHMAALASQLAGYTIFYNGPRCGASAPDHFHFQAVPNESLPIWKFIGQPSWAGICVSDNIPFGTIIITSDSFTQLADKASSIMKTLPRENEEYEPKVNVLCRCTGNMIQIIIIPRRAHRPAIYPHRMISPASIDLAGVLITTVADDFEVTDSSILSEVITEVCYTPHEVKQLIADIQ